MQYNEIIEIFMPTYNRIEQLKETLNQLFAADSPVKDFDITILDNNSDDGTYEYLINEKNSHPNLKVIRNKYNVGASVNLIKPFEMATKKYVWVLCDDDFYDWTSWDEVESFIENNVDIICVSDFVLGKNKKINTLAEKILQLSFMPSGIYKTELVNDTIVRNMYETSFALFPYMAPLFAYINNGGDNICVCSNTIVKNGWRQRKIKIDNSYTRGSNCELLNGRTANMLWSVGWCNILTLLHSKELIQECLELGCRQVRQMTVNQLVGRLVKEYTNNPDSHTIKDLVDCYCVLTPRQKKKMLVRLLIAGIKERLKLSKKVPKENIYERKCLNILGIKIKYKKLRKDISQYKHVLCVNQKYIDKKLKTFKPQPQKVIPNMVLSTTSYPERMKDIHYALYSLFNQSIHPEKFILWLAAEEFPNGEKDVPEKVLFFKKFGLEIRFTDAIRSFKKIVPALREFPNSILVSADDDIYYPQNWLSELYSAYQKDPTKIYAHRLHRVGIQDGKGLPYEDWQKCIIDKEGSYLNFPTSVAGILYPPDSLFKDATNKEIFTKLCQNQDDIWVWAMATLNNKVFVSPENPLNNDLVYVNPQRELGLSNESTLASINLGENANDRQMHAVVDFYNLIGERIKI